MQFSKGPFKVKILVALMHLLRRFWVNISQKMMQSTEVKIGKPETSKMILNMQLMMSMLPIWFLSGYQALHPSTIFRFHHRAVPKSHSVSMAIANVFQKEKWH